MSLTLSVNVTDDDIFQGEPGECDTCPIALAIERAAEKISRRGDWVHAEVFTEHAWLRIGPNRYRASLPQSVQDFIGRYDNALPAEPFEVTLLWESDPL